MSGQIGTSVELSRGHFGTGPCKHPKDGETQRNMAKYDETHRNTAKHDET